MKRFWILWSPQSHLPPTKRWDKRSEAVEVAEKMARAHPSQEFYVMQSVNHSQVASVRTVEIK